MYTLTEVLGKGAYAKVFKGFRQDNPNEVVAFKKMHIAAKDYEQGVPQNILREIALLRKLSLLSHPNIVKLYEVVPELSDPRNMSITLVLEYLPRSVLQYVENEPNITPQICRCLVHQMLQGVDFLHVNGVMHRDIKPENLLLSMDGVLKIADFGLSKHAHIGAYLTTVSVTLWYRPYEILLGCDYNTSADIWSVGMVMCQIFTRLPLIRTKSEVKTLRKIFYFLGLPEEHLWPEGCSLERKQFRKNSGNRLRKQMKIMCSHAYQLLCWMLDYDIDKRCSAADALNHEYFNPAICNCPFQAPFLPPLKDLQPIPPNEDDK